MDSRERVLRALRREKADRVPIHDSVWVETMRRWEREGYPAGIPPEDHFDWEIVSVWFDNSPMFEIKTLHADDQYIVETTPFGGVRRNLRSLASTPEIIDWGVKTYDDWLRVKERLRPDYTRCDWVTLRSRYQRARSMGKCVTLNAVIGFDYLQNLIKTEELLVIMIENPRWFREMVETVADLTLRMTEMVIAAGFEPDAAWFFNDMAYRNGPLFSPKLYRETILESDRALCSFHHARGAPVIYHTDGDIHLLIPHLIEAGVDCLQPLEVKAGMDVRQLVNQYGDRLSFMGNIDTRAMADPDPAALEREIIPKLEAAKRHGGYIFHSDHSVPPNVSYDQYRRALSLARQYGDY